MAKEERGPEAAYEERRAILVERGAALDGRERSVSLLRGITFLAAVALAVLGGTRQHIGFWIAAGVSLATFIAAVIAHAVLITRKAEIDQRIALVARGLARIRDEYQDFPEKGEKFSPELHPYSKDLDVFGHRSLFQLLSTAETVAGRGAMAAWLLTGASAKTVVERQTAARELSERPDLLEDISVLAHNARAKLPPDALFAWGEAKSIWEEGGNNGGTMFALRLRFLAPITVTLAVLGWTLGPAMGPFRHAWVVTMAVQLVVALRTGVMTERALAAASSREEPLGRFAPLFARIEKTQFSAALLERCRAAMLSSKPASRADSNENGSPGASATIGLPTTIVTASHAMSRLQTILGFADIRHAGMVHILVHLFTLWDVWCAVAIEKWRAEHGKRIRLWMDALATLEALSSIATFTYEHPDYVFPEVTPGKPHFIAKELAHPLLARKKRIANSIAFHGTESAKSKADKASPQALLITGSNMSGKSTMLRAIGTNAVLALAGAPVCAAQLSMSELDVRTSMRITDSLEQGVSHFYAELSRLKEITTVAEAGNPVLFLLDEVLHGTNSRERQVGAKAVVKHLLKHGAIGAVSSHDLGLSTLEEETAGIVKNAHFEEHVEDGKMAFDYKLKPGIVTTTNALRLMRVVGLPVEEDS